MKRKKQLSVQTSFQYFLSNLFLKGYNNNNSYKAYITSLILNFSIFVEFRFLMMEKGKTTDYFTLVSQSFIFAKWWWDLFYNLAYLLYSGRWLYQYNEDDFSLIIL